jgi:cell division protein FtsB
MNTNTQPGAPAAAAAATPTAMDQHIAAINALATANQAMKPRTAFLEVALGALSTAAANSALHVKAVAQAKAKADAQVATLESAKAEITAAEAAVQAGS